MHVFQINMVKRPTIGTGRLTRRRFNISGIFLLGWDRKAANNKNEKEKKKKKKTKKKEEEEGGGGGEEEEERDDRE